MTQQKPVRIVDVARAAGVSVATVSRTLSNPQVVNEATRQTVFEAIRSTGYRVNRAARNLRMQRAGAVLVMVPDLGNPFFSQVLAGISAGFAESDHAVLIADTAGQDAGAIVDHYFRDGRIDGLICLDAGIRAEDLARLAAQGIGDRIVFACEWIEGTGFASVRCDNEGGARLAMEYLHGLGHRAIAHLTGPAGNVLTHVRRAAMQAERRRLDLPARPEWIIRGDFSLASGEAAARQILAMDHRPTAVFCASDMGAFGLIAGLIEGGLRVPQDISVIGFDDIELAGHFLPSLTTIRQDRRRIGETAAELLRARLDRADSRPLPENRLRRIGVELMLRGSTGPAPRSIS
ncbi:LacI family DNA-binding transcriptional regulator [Mangrovicoccus algicola]|uniref:LacI family DNA-binding transcriptional regulator n=1 Tax=Mangrovicoccus algicola TaxID=2771008 RepID=A0A8J6YXY7_9RHOB|nr:LacI family DNA-binding transcriptional regulator [Mangrovicoccus algicola]MBE3637986.1 LacI family DNA-binding transcriptional regulator [Mangrovicoccus algicola]